MRIIDHRIQIPPRQRFERQHAGPGELPVHLRNAQPLIVGERLPEPRRRGRFVDVVQLPRDRLLELRDDRRRTVNPRLRHQRFQRLRQPLQKLHVQRDDAVDVRPANFDDHFFLFVLEPRAVHLPDRRTGERRLADPLEALADRPTQLPLDRLHGRRSVKRWHSVLQRAKLLDHLRGKQVRPGAQHLPQFDERRPQLRAHQRQPPPDRRRPGLRRGLDQRPLDHPHRHEPAQVQPRDRVPEPVPSQNPGDMPHPVQRPHASSELQRGHHALASPSTCVASNVTGRNGSSCVSSQQLVKKL